MEEMSTPPRSRPSLVEAAFSNRLHQAEKKSRSPLTSSPAGQRLSVAAFPVSPVVSNNQENESPDCLFNRHGLGILYPETPKTYRTVSYLERERNCFSIKSRSSPSEASPKESPMCSNITSDLELDQLLDDVKDHSQMSPGIPYEDDDNANDSDDYDNDVIQLRKRSRLSWSDENLNRHSENASNYWVAESSLKRSPRSTSELQLSQAATTTKTGRRRMNNVTFNFSSSASNAPSKQRSTLKGILKKANLTTQYNTDGISNGHLKTSVSKTPYSQGPQHRSSEDLFLEISQQDFFDPPSIRGSNAAKHLLESRMGKRWSSYDSLHSKNSQSALQRDFSELDSDAIIKRPSVNPDDINFSFTDQMNSSSKTQQQSQQNKTYSTEFSNIRNHAAFRHFMLDNSMENSPEARPLFGDPNDSRWSFTPYNFYLETLSKQLNEQNRSPEHANPDNSFSSADAIKSTTKDITVTDINNDPQIEDSAIPMNFPLAKDDDKSTPAKSGPLPNSAEAAGNQKFSSVLSPDQVQFSPTTEADRKAIVRNLCSVFENSDISLDGSEPGSAKKSRSWYDLDKTPPAQLTDEQRNYANTLIEKYTRLPTDRSQNLAT
ncbi:unnamed protein product [Acanthosepion pharaonis]|uniref:Uncharacterized protein n=1 Tax=Acanthosepion pharaonis TaxID=158019 RepID=A0A812B698_ACAPH|nr:unnamed protein product [Sepia pharaonis]